MVTKTTPRQLAALGALLVVLVVVAVYRLKPALVEQVVAGSKGGVARIGAYEVPRLGWSAKATPAPASENATRSLFTFGPPPTPTPDTRPTPTPPPVPPVIPTPMYMEEPEPVRTPPPPNFSLSFIGWLGPDRLPIAVFRDSNDLLVVPKGDTIKNRFILRDVGPTSVTIGYVGFPANMTRKVPLSQ